jgi:hypothetical protein
VLIPANLMADDAMPEYAVGAGAAADEGRTGWERSQEES